VELAKAGAAVMSVPPDPASEYPSSAPSSCCWLPSGLTFLGGPFGTKPGLMARVTTARRYDDASRRSKML